MNTAEHEIEILRGHELRLLRCTPGPPPSTSSSISQSFDSGASPSPLHALISNILTSIESSDYLGALSSDAARPVLASPDSDLSSDLTERVYSELLNRVESFINEPSIDDAEKACRVVLFVCVAVAALFWFTQCNLTGPVEGSPKHPLPMKAWWEGSEMVEWENWASNELMAAGALTCLASSLIFRRDSWQMWENYSHVAYEVGNIGQALEAIKTVLNLTTNERIDVELLERIMQYLEERASDRQSAVTNDDDFSNQTSPHSLVYSVNKSANAEQTAGRLRENEHLVEFLGKILQQIVRSESRADLWGLYARWHRIKGDLTMCCEALLKQVRSYQGSNLWKDRGIFKRFAQASLELCKVYMDISSSTGSCQELLTAEMHLKNALKRAGIFSDTEEFRNLEACLDEVKMKQLSESTAT